MSAASFALPWRRSRGRAPRAVACEQAELPFDAGGPGRGWYDLVTADAGRPLGPECLPAATGARRELVLLRVDIGGYRGADIDAAGLARIERALRCWEAAGRMLVVRATYDVGGEALLREPDALEQVVRHARQVGEVVSGHARSVLCYQGLLVGNWGEMHGTRYCGARRMASIYEALRAGVGREVPICVRTPRHVRLLRGASERAREDCALGVFDDAMMGSESDLGSFDPSGAQDADAARAEFLSFLGDGALRVPFGGEAVGTGPWSDVPEALGYLRATRPTYLNAAHDPATMEKWRRAAAPVADERRRARPAFANMLDYVGAHLGYRLLASDARVIDCRQGGAGAPGLAVDVSFTVENRGFAPLYWPASMTVSVVDACDGKKLGGVREELPWDGAPGARAQVRTRVCLDAGSAAGACAHGALVVAGCARDADGASLPLANGVTCDLARLVGGPVAPLAGGDAALAAILPR